MTEHIVNDAIPRSSSKRERKVENIDTPMKFSEVYEQYHQSIYRYSLARVGNTTEAQDITSQVFLKGFKNFSEYRHESPVIYWLIRIARNQIVDYYRTKRADSYPLDRVQIPDPALDPEETLERRQRLERVSEALNALTEDRREALSLRLFAALTNQEIAGIMGKSPAAVAMLVHRGIQDLRERLGDEI